MELARRAGIDVAPVELTTALGRDALLVERFDRPAADGSRAMVSALTILDLDELEARYASYADLARIRSAPASASRRATCASSSPASPSTSSSATATTTRATTPPSGTERRSPDARLRHLPAAARRRRDRTGDGDRCGDGYRYSRVAGCVDRASIYLLEEAEAREIVDRRSR